jgi:hypothetical protein
MRPLVLVMTAVAVAACGPAKPGPQANVTYFWKITKSTVAFNDNCSDDPKFRSDNGPIAVSIDEDANQNGVLDPGEDLNKNGKLDTQASYFVYQASSDAKSATLMKCGQLDPSTCTPDDSQVVFSVAGAELDFSTELRTFTGFGKCNILDTQAWILTDKVSTLDIEISDTFSLVDDPTTCDMLEKAQEMRSPNGKGFQGCTVTFNLSTTSGR